MKRFLKVIFILGISFALILFLFRNIIFRYEVKRISGKFEKRCNARMIVGEKGFNGLLKIYLNNVVLISETNDTLFSVSKLESSVSLWRLIKGKIPLTNINLDGVNVNFILTDSLQNFACLMGAHVEEGSRDTTLVSNYAGRVNFVVRKLFYSFDNPLSLKNFLFRFKLNNDTGFVNITRFTYDGEKYEGISTVENHAIRSDWKFSGEIYEPYKIISFNAAPVEESKKEKVFVSRQCSFFAGSISSNIVFRKLSSKNVECSVSASVKEVFLNYRRISDQEVLSGFLGFEGKFLIDKTSVTLQESQVKLNSLPVKIDFSISNISQKTIALQLNTGNVESSVFFESLPDGMFNSLKGIKTSGTLNYHLRFSLYTEIPDSLIFESELKKENFRIQHFGKTNLRLMDTTFLFTAYDGDKIARTFPVGPENPEFTPYNQINDYLKYAILTSEDGGFFFHNGFNKEAFRESIITNYKEGRFVRGGSTISMQLVKNVFLSRQKTLSRKLEELLIVWLIENNRLATKERMLEVYLNIIEWGPNIYGIGEAAHFYFNKKPSELTLAESIYLASIIPHPKYFKYSFDTAGNLKPFLQGYYRLVADRMLRKNQITPADTVNLIPNVKLNGPAVNLILPLDSLPADSLQMEEQDFLN